MNRGPATSLRHRRLGIAALVLGALTTLALVVAVVVIATDVSHGAGGFALMGWLPIFGPIVGGLTVSGIALGIPAVALTRPRTNAVVGLSLSVLPVFAFAVVLVVSPWTTGL